MDAPAADAPEDLSAVSWVLDELRRSLEAAHKALRRHLRESESLSGSDVDSVDPGVLRQARQQLHQGAGALELVGMASGASLLRASEAAVHKMTQRPALVDLASVETIERASFALLDYLTRMLAGKPTSPLSLFPQYRAVKELAGGDRVHPADLWPVAWQWQAVDDDPTAAPRRVDAAARTAIEANLLAMLRQPRGAAAGRMSDLFAGLAAGAGDAKLRTLWALAAAFFEGQARGLLQPNVYGKRMASRLLAQLRLAERAASGAGADVSERLAHDLLFFCAQAGQGADGPATPRLAAARRAFGVTASGPVDYETPRLGRFDPAWIAQARKRVASAKDSWSAVAGDELHRLPGLVEQFSLVGDSLRRLYPQGDQLADAMQDAVVDTVDHGRAPAPELAMEVATSMLYLDASLEDADFDDPDLGPRVQRLAQRIGQVRQGMPPPSLEGWMEDLYRRVSDRQTMGSVVQELRASLSEIEKLIDPYFRDPSQRQLLIPVPGQLQSMRGVLTVLGLDEASQAVLRMRDDVDELASTEVDPERGAQSGNFDRLAANLGALGFLIDMLSVQPQLAKSMFEFDAAEGRLRSIVGGGSHRAAQISGRELDPTPSNDLLEQAQSLAESVVDAPLDAVSRDLDRLSQQATAADQPVLARAVSAAQVALDAASDDAARQAAREGLARAMADLAPAVPVVEPPAASAPIPPPSPPTAPGRTGLEDDAEMREIFLEEAHEVIDGARAALAALAEAPGGLEDLTTVRRAFHTLKGSARMVGLRDFGEAAWSCEQLYNARLAEAPQANDDLIGFSGDAIDYLADWVDALAAGRDGGHGAGDVQSAADSLRLQGVRQPVVLPGQAFAAAMAGQAASTLHAPDEVPTLVLDAPASPEQTLALRVPDLPSAADLDLGPLTGGEPAEAPDDLSLTTDDTLPLDLMSLDTEWAQTQVRDTQLLDALAPSAPPAPFDLPFDLPDTTADRSPDAVTDDASADLPTEPAPWSDEPLPTLPMPDLDGFGLPVADAAAPPPREPSPFTLSFDPLADASPVDPGLPDVSFSLDLGALDGPAETPWPAFDIPGEALTPADGPLAQTSAPDDGPVHDATVALAPSVSPDDAAAASPDPLAGQELAEDMAALQAAFGAPAGAAPVDAAAFAALAPEPEPEPEQALQPEPEPEAQPVDAIAPDAAARSEPEPEPEPYRVIGPLRIGIPLFNIYLNEADELSRRLGTELAEWSHELHRPVGETAIALAHSLAGSSSTVGFADLSQLARALEHALMRSHAHGQGHGDDAALFIRAADDIRRLLHQFAAGFLVPVEPGLVDALAAYERAAAQHASEPDSTLASAPFDPMPSGDGDGPAWPTSAPADLDPVPDDEPAAATLPAAELPVLDDAVPAPAAAPLSAADWTGLELGAAPLAALAPVSETPVHGSGASETALDSDEDVDAVDLVDDELFPIFEEEAQELLPQLASRMREWARRPSDPSGASACMRTLHTLKGGARLAGAMRLGELAHRLETAIERLLARGDVTPADVEVLLGRVDTLLSVFESLRDGPAVPVAVSQQPAEPLAPADWSPPAIAAPVPGDVPDPSSPAPADTAPASPAESLAPIDPWTATRDERAAGAGIDWGRFAARPFAAAPEASAPVAATASAVRVRVPLLDRLVNQAGEVSITRSRIEADVSQLKGSLSDLTDNLERLRSQLRDLELQAETQISSRMEAAKAAAESFDPLELDRFTRFQELTRMMAESVNDVATVQRSLQRTLQSTEDELAAQARLTRELQDDLLRTRMVEFEGLSERLYRVVRQAAKETGKQVRLDIVGGSIEVDRGVLDRMTGSFEHLLRNCVTHGIERPDDRVAHGKEATGQITVSLTQEGNEVGIEFRDDGGGLNLARIRDRGVAMGLIDPDQPHTDADLANLIFTAGFSTASSVTELAGRGVGMDVVRSDVVAMGGRIETATTAGQGTSFRLVLPLTTAVTRVVMLRCGQRTVAVPSTLIEIVRRVPHADVAAAYVSGGFAFGDKVLPFFWLGALLQDGPRSVENVRSATVVVVRSAQQRVALHVDEVVGNQEVVVKNLGAQLARVPGLAGVTLLASGVPALIYNPVALATLYGDGARRESMADSASGGDAAAPVAETRAPLVLVVDDSLTVRRVTQRLLVREGYRVALAKDGLDAIERLAEEKPAVVLSDIEMPRMDGFDLVRQMRSDSRWRELPVIMITSRIAQKHRDVAAELGVNHYLGKPYGEEDLLALVAHYVSAPEPA